MKLFALIAVAAALAGSQAMADETRVTGSRKLSEKTAVKRPILQETRQRLGEELTWREFATEQRGSEFRRFWNAAEDHPVSMRLRPPDSASDYPVSMQFRRPDTASDHPVSMKLRGSKAPASKYEAVKQRVQR